MLVLGAYGCGKVGVKLDMTRSWGVRTVMCAAWGLTWVGLCNEVS